MIIDKDKIAAYQFGGEMVHSCATPRKRYMRHPESGQG
jgi:hypothetical protein